MTVFQTAIRFIQINKQNISDKEVFFLRVIKAKKRREHRRRHSVFFAYFSIWEKKTRNNYPEKERL